MIEKGQDKTVERYVEAKGSVTCSRFVNVNFNRFWRLVEVPKFESLTLFRNVNHKRVDTELVTFGH